MHRLRIILRLHFRVGTAFFPYMTLRRMSAVSRSFFFATVATFWASFRPLPKGYLFTTGAWPALGRFPIVIKRWHGTHQSFWRYGGTAFLVFYCCIPLRLDKSRNKRQKRSCGQYFFENLLAGLSLSKIFEIWAPNVFPMTACRFRPTSSTKIYRTNWTPLFALWKVLRGASSSSSLTIFSIFFASSSLQQTSPLVRWRIHFPPSSFPFEDSRALYSSHTRQCRPLLQTKAGFRQSTPSPMAISVRHCSVRPCRLEWQVIGCL